MRSSHLSRAILMGLLLMPSAGVAQDRPRPTLFEGSAVVRVNDDEYKIAILCNDASRPELGFTTEANRITREATGRYNRVVLRVRPWKETGDVIVTLDRYVAWMPQPTSAGGLLSSQTPMSPVNVIRDNIPVAVTYEMWADGDRPSGLEVVEFEANCSARDPEAPAYRKLPDFSPRIAAVIETLGR